MYTWGPHFTTISPKKQARCDSQGDVDLETGAAHGRAEDALDQAGQDEDDVQQDGLQGGGMDAVLGTQCWAHKQTCRGSYRVR